MDDDELPYKVKRRKKMALLSSSLENTDQQRKTKRVQAQESCPEKDYIHCVILSWSHSSRVGQGLWRLQTVPTLHATPVTLPQSPSLRA